MGDRQQRANEWVRRFAPAELQSVIIGGMAAGKAFQPHYPTVRRYIRDVFRGVPTRRPMFGKGSGRSVKRPGSYPMPPTPSKKKKQLTIDPSPSSLMEIDTIGTQPPNQPPRKAMKGYTGGRKKRSTMTKKRYVKKRYNRKRYAKKKKYMPLNTCTLKKESGNKIADPDCVYVGLCSTPVVLIMQQLGRTILKELFRQYRIEFDDWTKTISSQRAYTAVKIRLEYYADETTSSILGVNATSLIASDDTMDTLAIKVADQLNGVFGVYAKKQLLSANLFWTSSNIPEEEVGEIRAADFKFHYHDIGKLDVQNITLASAGTATETDNVTQNPLKGYVYRTAGNGLRPKVRSTMSQSLLTDKNNGSLREASAGLNSSLRKPAQSSYWKGSVSAKGTKLLPGQIITYKVTNKKSQYINAFLYNVQEDVNQITSRAYSAIGKTVAVGMEKLLNNRAESTGVELGYEYTLIMKCGYTYKPKIYIAPLVIT